jgi:hypothetical protein
MRHPEIAAGQVWRQVDSGALLVIHERLGDAELWSARRGDGAHVEISAESLFASYTIEVNQFGRGFPSA